MKDLLDRLRNLASQAQALVAEVLDEGVMRAASDSRLAEAMDAAGAAIRPLETILAEGAGEIAGRSDSPVRAERMTTRFGCRTPRDLVAQLTRFTGRRSSELLTAGRAIGQPVALTTGEPLAALFPELRSAAADGDIGADAIAAVAAALESAALSSVERSAADLELAASARGDGVDGAPPATADELRLQAQVWAMYLDQDGAEPRDERAARKRGMSLGHMRDGLVPVRGDLLPEVAAQLQRLWDSILNPRLDGPRFVPAADSGDEPFSEGHDDPEDRRTPAQRRHDALATVLTTAAASGELPTIGGAAPTLVVSVTAEDLAAGSGHAHLDGSEAALPVSVARQVGCTGAIHRVTHNAHGRILALEISDRLFSAHQRRAIALRDGGCIIPGCGVATAWCEIHHVHEAARGGATHTDNGVLLCWHHHRTLDSSGWQIRMREGIPEVRAPRWRDTSERWRPATKSPLMRRRRFATGRATARSAPLRT